MRFRSRLVFLSLLQLCVVAVPTDEEAIACGWGTTSEVAVLLKASAREEALPLIIFPLLARYSPPDVTLFFSSPRPPFTRRASEAHSPDDATLAALA